MAKIKSVETAEYIQQNIELYSKQRVGEYTKYLQRNPYFVTYYHISQNRSRADVGTGGIQDYIGKASPIRFNKLKDFPIYGISEITPDLTYDETGLDTKIDISDLMILPNTIKPIPGDMIVFSIDGSGNSFMFRVTDVRLTSIQSNDFVSITCDLYYVDKNNQDGRLKQLNAQVVAEYQTIFENIGTEDNCFLLAEDVIKVNNLAKVVDMIKEFYLASYYNRELSVFVLYNNAYSCLYNDTPHWNDDRMRYANDIKIRRQDRIMDHHGAHIDEMYSERYGWTDTHWIHDRSPLYNRFLYYTPKNVPWLYDPMVEQFFTNTNLWNKLDEKILALSAQDILPTDFNREYMRTVWYAVEHKMTRLLADHMYCYQASNMKRFSVFKRFDVNSNTNLIHMSRKALDRVKPTDYTPDCGHTYYVHGCMCCADILCAPMCHDGFHKQYWVEYFGSELIESLRTGEKKVEDQLDVIIYNYMNGIKEDIDVDGLISYVIDSNFRNFIYLAVILYILTKEFDAFFETEVDLG